MSRGDEIEEDEPPRRRRAPARTDEPNDDDIAGRPLRGRRASRAPLVTATGIVTICYGGILLACGMLASMGGACCAASVPWLKDFMVQMAPNDPNVAQAHQDLGQAQTASWVLMATGLLRIGVGVGLVGCGIGILRRSNIARFAVLAVAVFNLFALCIGDVAEFALGVFEAEDAPMTVISALLAVSFAAFAFIVLLIPKHAREFAN
jgi:hypothetical protein